MVSFKAVTCKIVLTFLFLDQPCISPVYHSEPNIGVFSKVGKAEGSLPTTDLCAVGAVYCLEMEGRKVEL